MTAFVTVLPLAGCFLTGWALPRLQSSTVGGAVAVTAYLLCPTVVYAVGDWRDFSYQKLRGASRLAGLLHETGFNRSGEPSSLQAVFL